MRWAFPFTLSQTKYNQKAKENMKNVRKAIDELQIFLEEDMWHAIHSEWKTEGDMLKYLRAHFNIFRKEIGEKELNIKYEYPKSKEEVKNG